MLQLRPGLVLVSAAPCEDVGDVAARCPLPASACVLALVRSAFLPHGEVPPPLEELLAPLGHGVVALAASSVQVPERALFVDAFAFDPSSASTEPAFAHCVALPAYLRSWCGAARSPTRSLAPPRRLLTRASSSRRRPQRL